jgi:hypothetical protein
MPGYRAFKIRSSTINFFINVAKRRRGPENLHSILFLDRKLSNKRTMDILSGILMNGIGIDIWQAQGRLKRK